MGELLASFYSNTDIPKNSILLTFDDGFKDHFSYVFPILKKLNIQACFFPPSKPIEEFSVLDVHKINYILSTTSQDELIEERKERHRTFHVDESLGTGHRQRNWTFGKVEYTEKE